jgi:hypothetical protein
MKFVLTYTWRDGGSAAEREQMLKRSMQLLGKFSPSDPTQIKEWVDRVDGEGGFALLESDDPIAMMRDIAIWIPMLRFELHPVVDVADAMPAQQEALDFLDSVS